MNTFKIRKLLLDIARQDVGKVEVTKNRAPWIEKLWPATSLGTDGYTDRAPYCAAGVAYCVQQWLKNPAVLEAFNFTYQQASSWRCKSAGAFAWQGWAEGHGLTILPKECILHAGDLVIYDYSHIEIVSDDDGTPEGPFMAIGYNTNSAGSRDGEGCFEKPRTRKGVRCFVRMLS